MKISTAINSHKALVVPVVLFLMWFYRNSSTEAFVYLALHGTYSWLWLAKHALYPDVRFEEQKPAAIGIFFIFLPLAAYYVAPFLLISRHVQLAPWVIGLVLFLYIVGVFCHFVGDAQKYYTLRLQKGLIEDGMFGRTRNPNYLGEILIYSAYALLSRHWLSFVILSGWVFGFFLPNMLKKDTSLSRYPEFAAYKKRTGLVFPKLF